MHRIELLDVPAQCALHPLLSQADFHDSYRFPIPDSAVPPLEILIGVMAGGPAWIERLMWVRNKVVRMFGLKDLGALGSIDPAKPLESYRPGDRLGIFSLLDSQEAEVVVCDRDKHLDVWLSVRKLPSDDTGHWAAITTVVRTKNRLGTLYMWVVEPMHRLIVPASLRVYVARRTG